ncbi:hypothetical protein MXL46_13840 [Heyndrickxia sporothermodurans]|uniref:hypothetical protein n=1 Tax=Heyndrickxia sporothermodurans TaxID=46224 RepID=UPI002DBDE37F|nr:hypothetical protein [Heyndrickxia sporothermodurans]MEB6550172.1 hypothetical protein [Heyndrickxia sporothermodurans]
MNTEIAKTILNQIRILDKFALMAWGTSEFVALQNGVQFKIRTPLYKRGGRVKITLNSMDTYDIEVFKIVKSEIITLKKSNDIYCDQLVEVLDSLIEEDEKNNCFILKVL